MRMRVNVFVRHNMDSEEDAANENSMFAEIPCQQREEHLHGSVANRVSTDPDTQNPRMRLLTDRSGTSPLEYQDSQLSPALTLLPCLDKSHGLSDSTFFQHTDTEFVPLRGFPDLSVISETCPRFSRAAVTDASDLLHTIHEQATLSQHPLEALAALSEGDKSFCSLSQHSLSPGGHGKGSEGQESVSYVTSKMNRHMEGEEQTTSQQLGEGKFSQPLLESREEDVLEPVKSGGDISSSSNDQNADKNKSTNLQTCREHPQGGALSLSSSFQKSAAPAVSSVSNITFRDSEIHQHKTTDQLHEHLFDRQRVSISAPASRHHSGNKSSDSGLFVTPAGEGVLHGPGLLRTVWSSGHLTAADGSYLSSQPVSQSTPAVPLVRLPPALTKLSLIQSKQEAVNSAAAKSHSKPGLLPSLDLDQHSSPIGSQTTVLSGPSETAQNLVSNEQASLPVLNPPSSEALHSSIQPFYSHAEMKDQVPHLALGRVKSLPSLSYLQKVDAWKANQSSSMSFCDNLGMDGLVPKKTARDAVPEGLTQDTRQAFVAQMTPQLSSSHSGSGSSPCRADVVGAAARRQASDSPLNHSHSRSSLSSVVTSIQRDTSTHSQPVLEVQPDDIIPPTRSLDNRSSIRSAERDEEESSLTPHMDKSCIKQSPLISLGRFSDVSLSLNMSSTLSSSQGSGHGEQSMRASVGAASSVVSLEVDNYAPYWTSRPTSPPRLRELNIEDRISVSSGITETYLLNLGIDQSPSTILNPFTRRGPIREPEFSPTDLCTIKGSIGTPTKSTQPSEADSLQKETLSSSSQLSADSSSVAHRLSMPEQNQPASDRNVKIKLTEAETPQLHSTMHSSSLQQSSVSQSEGNPGLPIQLSRDSLAPPAPREVLNDSLVGSGTLHEIRRLLGHAESLISAQSFVTSSSASHRLSESDTSLAQPGRSTRDYHDDTSLSTGGNLSLLLTRSSSDSALKGSLSSSHGPQQITTIPIESTAVSLSREEGLKSRELCVTPRRAEPEGCSAGDPDKTKPLTATSAVQANLPMIAGKLQQDQGKPEDHAIDSSENSSSHDCAEVKSLSDSSSESSLAARVAKLLQSETPVSMVASRPSTADPEESRAREWILMKVSGRRCESLELNAEDRKRTQEIKRDLLMNTKYTKWCTDSEGSSQSSVGPGTQVTKGFVGLRNMVQPNPLDTVPFYTAVQQDSGTNVKNIALSERLGPQPFISMTTETTHHTPSPQSLPQCPVIRTMAIENVDPEHEEFECKSHHRGADTREHVQVTYQTAIEPIVSDIEKETERGRADLENKVMEKMMVDNKENTITKDLRRMSHMDYPGTSSSRILSSDKVWSSDFWNKSHLPQVHVISSPKHPSNPVKNHSSKLSYQNLSKDVSLQRDSLTVSRRSDEHVRSTGRTSPSNHLSSYEHRDTVQGQNARTDHAVLQSRHPQSLAPSQMITGTTRGFSLHTTSKTAAVPALLPYKPHGSSELFYVPQTDPELSGRSDTTVESSHPGSDDAVPPHFDINILGSRELDDDIIIPKHKEGIYSKRANMKRVSDGLSQSDGVQNDRTVPDVYLERSMETVGADEEERFVPLHMEADYSIDDLHLHSRTVQEPNLPLEPHHSLSQPIRKASVGNKNKLSRTPHDVSIEVSSSLDQLWRRFNEKWSTEETRPTNERETSLLERLERLSRLIHNTSSTDQTIAQTDRTSGGQDRKSDREDGNTTGEERREKVQSEVALKQAWPEYGDDQDGVHRCPAEKDETSTSLSTVDSERLLRASGQHRVSSKGQKLSDSLARRHNTINVQKSDKRKPSAKHSTVSAATNDVSTDDSTVSAGSLSSSSTFPQNSTRRVSQNLNSKRTKVKLYSKSVQAGDLEIVMNATRRHTRDVGTIFPSPGALNNLHSTNTLGRDVKDGVSIPTASSSKHTQTLISAKRDTGSKSVRTRYPNAWFEPYSKIQPWKEATREPLRERQNQPEHERPTESIIAMKTDDRPSALVRLSLQEALALHRPEFVSRSRERMKRLGLLVEERRLQAVFSREREELFNYPAPSRALRPAPVPRKRVVPRKEMVQRSKEKYAQLPEVQKRKEEERRRAAYRSYRLNARHFNKKVTNRVLGRRTPWQEDQHQF